MNIVESAINGDNIKESSSGKYGTIMILSLFDVMNNISINYYLSFVSWVMVGTGMIFELPVLSFILSTFGLLTPTLMRKFRRHAIVVIMVLSAIITPPDPVSLIIMSIPLMILYEISILVSWMVLRGKSPVGHSIEST